MSSIYASMYSCFVRLKSNVTDVLWQIRSLVQWCVVISIIAALTYVYYGKLRQFVRELTRVCAR